LISLLKALKRKSIDVSVETSLYVQWENIKRCIGLVGTFLVDLKHTEKEKFNIFTRGNLDLIITNIKKLAGINENIIIRIPVIPDFNHSEIEMTAIIDFIASLTNITEIHFLPYHTLGVEKYNMLGIQYLFGNNQQVDDSSLMPYIKYAQSKGFNARIGG
jgi:pyruvate formate lyase activating enzyme